MKEFMKINNIFTFDAKNKGITGLTPTYNVLKNIVWEGTEKVDGTNIRVHWDGHRVEFAGRTDKAEIPADLKAKLEEMFCTQEMEYVFEQVFEDKDVILFGEGYGPKIQNGGTYSKEPKFILFDVCIDDHYLSRANVNDIAEKLCIDAVPVMFVGTLDEAIEYVRRHHMSTLGNGEHEMEGLVLQPLGIVLYDSKFHPVKCKCKYRDVIRYNNFSGNE